MKQKVKYEMLRENEIQKIHSKEEEVIFHGDNGASSLDSKKEENLIRLHAIS